VVGDPAETRTVLTRQDWRPDDGVGWGTGGAWLLEVRPETSVEPAVLLAEPRAVDRVRLRLGERAVELEVGPEETGFIRLPRTELPAGPLDLRVEAFEGEAPVPIHQVLLERP